MGLEMKPSGVEETSPIPLCVDLDGTLLQTDTLEESVVALARINPALLMLLPVWLSRGKAHLKQAIAARAPLDPESLPYREELLEFLRAERLKGRSLWLVTGAPKLLADAIAKHLDLFDGVLATKDATNLTGVAKLQALEERFPQGFDYAGNAAADLPVWKAARHALLVGTPEAVARQARRDARVHVEMGKPRSRLRAFVRTLRVHQWAKNALVFVPVLTSHKVRDLPVLAAACVAFTAFSVVASAVYIINDILDVESDRRHKRKRNRPIASGALPIGQAVLAVPVLLATGAGLSALVPLEFGVILAAYFMVTLAYSLGLKRRPVVDVLILAGLYTFRILGGGAATGIVVSEWLTAFSMFFFLSLAFLKRLSELVDSGGAPAGRGYLSVDWDTVLAMGTSSGYLSVLVLALYVSSQEVRGLYNHPRMLWLICPFILFWISRVWVKARRGLVHDDPVVFALKDRVTYLIGAAMAAVMILAAR
jgi:4-hydroxybenzoate polyprenyltransferase/phosphoserine phosphatase